MLDRLVDDWLQLLDHSRHQIFLRDRLGLRRRCLPFRGLPGGCRGFSFWRHITLTKNKMADQSTAKIGGSNPTQGKKTTLKISEFLGSDKCILFAQDAFIVFLLFV